MANEDKARLGLGGMLLLAARNPLGVAVYAVVALAVRWRDRGRAGAAAGAAMPDWSRGR